jgi:gamma-glutamylcyclotransferase (GGCT)/AIG2-like uncharacterized protein YtfP
MPSPYTRHVFVYGTLRKGEERDINRLRPAPQWVGRASVEGLMHHLGSYPGLVLGAPGTVHGEVYAVSAELERILDEIEEVWPQQTGEYAKREVMVRLEAGRGGSSPCGAARFHAANCCAFSMKSHRSAPRESLSSPAAIGCCTEPAASAELLLSTAGYACAQRFLRVLAFGRRQLGMRRAVRAARYFTIQ